jgi:phosphoesterase RecJ-like protein
MSKELSCEDTWELLQTKKNFIIVSHIGPDGDTTGSTLALAEALRQVGKNVTVMVDDKVGSNLQFVPGVDSYVRPQAGTDYPADLLIVVDASSIDRIGIVRECVKAPILNIDHHISNTRYADYLWLNAKAAAVGQMIYELVKVMHVKMTLTMATCIYVAIVTDCGYFKYSNTTPDCMRVAADLVEFGVEPNLISDYVEMKSKAVMEMLPKVLATMQFWAENKIATIEISNAIYDEDVSTESFISYPRYIDGVEVAVMFKEVEKSVTRVSMRSRSLDVSEVALLFNGGGHQKAAGCTINKPLGEAKKLLLNQIIKEVQGAKC